MKIYWANAKTEDLELLSTYEGCTDIHQAERQFGVWEEYGYRIREKWIAVYEDGKEISRVTVF